MEITVREQELIQIISVTGRIDAASGPALQNLVTDMVTAGKKRFVINLKAVDYISSGGLRVLLMLAKKIKSSSGGMILSNLHPFVEDLLTMAGFNKLIPVADSEEKALLFLESGGD